MPEGSNYKVNIPGESQQSSDNFLKFQIQKLYGQAFPSLASQALFKVEGAKDLLKQTITNKIGHGFKIPQEQEKAKIDWKGVEVAQIDQSNVRSYLGTPIFAPITLKAGNYNVLDNGKAIIKNFPNDLILPATATAQFDRAKIRTDTVINGTSGSVKELWGFDDWQITIRGLLITEGNHKGSNADIFPQSELERLYEFDNITDSIEVSGLLFGILNIKRITMDKISLSQIQGMPNVLGFQIPCKSDEAVELIMNNNQLGN